MEGDLETIMAGLNCGVPSGIGWPILKDAATAFLSCDDQVTVSGMKHYFNPIGGINLLFFYYCAILYTNVHVLVCQFINWTNWVNSGKFMDNCWISCQVMADMKNMSTSH